MLTGVERQDFSKPYDPTSSVCNRPKSCCKPLRVAERCIEAFKEGHEIAPMRCRYLGAMLGTLLASEAVSVIGLAVAEQVSERTKDYRGYYGYQLQTEHRSIVGLPLLIAATALYFKNTKSRIEALKLILFSSVIVYLGAVSAGLSSSNYLGYSIAESLHSMAIVSGAFLGNYCGFWLGRTGVARTLIGAALVPASFVIKPMRSTMHHVRGFFSNPQTMVLADSVQV